MSSKSKVDALDVLDRALLSLVASGGQEAYGKALAEALTAIAGKTVSKDRIYILLFRLELRNLVQSRDQSSDERATPKGRLRRLYEITPAGIAALGGTGKSRSHDEMEGKAAA